MTNEYPERAECDFGHEASQPKRRKAVKYEEDSESVTCSECCKTIPRLDALEVPKHTDGKDITLYFCGETEANNYYLDQLRRTGI